MRLIIDIESNNLLQNGLDYRELPFKLKDSYKVWCIVVRNADTGATQHLVQEDITKANLQKLLQDCTELIGHNIVCFDMPVLMLYGVLDYSVGYPGEDSLLFGKPVKITDTLLWSKLLNADRFGGHSLAAWGKRLGNYKEHFEEWDKFSQEMLDYCIQDTSVNLSILNELIREQGQHDWSRPYSMEVKLADLTLRQELFGFELDQKLAQENIEDLTRKMQEISLRVNPLLPPKKMTKGAVSEFIPPKIKFKKNGEISAVFQRWLDKHNAEVSIDKEFIKYDGKLFDLASDVPIKTHEPATVDDIDTVKMYLLQLGWVPSEVKERDLVKNANKTTKNHKEIVEAIDRYVEQTLTGVFCDLRLDLLGCTNNNLRDFLLSKIDGTKPIYVPTTPKLAVGVEKEICPNLINLGEKAAFVKDVVHYYTYRHRKNSIAGGALDEDGEPTTGFLSAVREDGRVPTPADTLGANTGRYRHKIVCNIPRVTSLYGEQMRNMFKAGKGLYQLGYDFASLEARVMGHYVIGPSGAPYSEGRELAEALIAEKPNDIHSLNAKKLGIDRSAAKSFSYAAIYGAQPKKLSKMLGISEAEAKQLFNDYWNAVPALKELKQKVESAWNNTGKKTILGLDGRLLNTRSKHSLINVLFQSGGAICAKWSAVRLAQEMQKQGILGDPFVDKITDLKVWWLIHMHDEQQMAVHPKLMHIRVFSSDEEANENMQEGCSAIGHGTKGPYLGYKTTPVECIEKGINSAVQELGLRVSLGFEWIPGSSWGACH